VTLKNHYEREKMATRDEIFYYIENFFPYSQVSDMLLKVELSGNGRTQTVFVGGNSGEGSSMFLYSHFADSSDVTANEVLRLVGDSTYFGVQLINGFYVVCHVVNTSYMEPSDIRQELLLVGSAADKLEDSLLGTDLY
jgi:hypothetical protein